MNQFDHDKLDVYHLAIDFFAMADQIIEALPKGRGKLADQLTRAALSIKMVGNAPPIKWCGRCGREDCGG